MADFEAKPQQQRIEMAQASEKEIKYLDFVQVAVAYFIACFTSLYEFAKENSGQLKLGVQTVEGTVKTVIGPVYEKFHDVPFELLKFVDHKVEESLSELDRHVPWFVKQASSQARAVACEVQRAGVVDTAKNITKTVYAKYEPTAREMYTRYEPMVEHYAVSIWRSLNQLPLFPQMAHIAVPTVAYWSEKYNQIVCYTAERGYSVAEYMPLIPVDRIGKVFDEGVNGPTISTNVDVGMTQ